MIEEISNILLNSHFDPFTLNKYNENAFKSLYCKYIEKEDNITQEEYLHRYGVFMNITDTLIYNITKSVFNKITCNMDKNIDMLKY